MMKLYVRPFNPFARKVRLVLENKGLNLEVVDGLLQSNHEALKAVNGRNARLAIIDEASHMLVVGRPQEVSQIIRRVSQSQESGR